MILTRLLPIFLFLSTANSWAACFSTHMSYERTTSLGLSFGMGDSDSSASLSFTGGITYEVNVPLVYNNRRGCFKQSSALDFEVSSQNSSHKGSINIYAPRIEFNNVPGRIMSYINITAPNGSSSVNDLNFEIANISCVGEEVLSVHAFSGSMSDMNSYHRNVNSNQRGLDSNGRVNVFAASGTIATGQAAINIQESMASRGRQEVANELRNLPLSLVQSFTQRVGDSYINDLARAQVTFIPKIYASFQTSILGFSASDTFETQVGTHAACTKKFESVMKDFLFKSTQKNISGHDFNLKLKNIEGREHLSLKWRK